MKKHFYLLLIFIPSVLLAQPTITNMDNYSAGNVFKRYICDPTNITPGTAGANQHWNFTGLVISDTEIVKILAPSATLYGSQYPTATFAMYSSNTNQYSFITKTTGSNSVVGVVDTVDGISMSYSNSALLALRPINYNDNTIDTFVNTLTVSGPPPISFTGGGTVTITADGWGMLHLPDSAYTDVLRVKTVAIQRDSITFPVMTSINIIRTDYSWYSDDFSTPLLLWDSLDVSGAQSLNLTTVSYVSHSVLGAKNIQKNAIAFTGSLHNSELMLKGEFENGTQYKVDVVNLEGQKIFSSTFTANKNVQSFDLQKEIASGIYLVSIIKANDINSLTVLKLVKE
jgi:hypothetical protein